MRPETNGAFGNLSRVLNLSRFSELNFILV